MWRWWSGVVEAEGSASPPGTVTVGMSAWRGAGGLATLTGVLVVAAWLLTRRHGLVPPHAMTFWAALGSDEQARQVAFNPVRLLVGPRRVLSELIDTSSGRDGVVSLLINERCRFSST